MPSRFRPLAAQYRRSFARARRPASCAARSRSAAAPAATKGRGVRVGGARLPPASPASGYTDNDHVICTRTTRGDATGTRPVVSVSSRQTGSDALCGPRALWFPPPCSRVMLAWPRDRACSRRVGQRPQQHRTTPVRLTSTRSPVRRRCRGTVRPRPQSGLQALRPLPSNRFGRLPSYVATSSQGRGYPHRYRAVSLHIRPR